MLTGGTPVTPNTNGDQFSIALLLKPRQFKTEAELNELRSFASSKNPKWIEAPAFSLDTGDGSAVRFLKLDREVFDVRHRDSGDSNTCPVLSYVGVYESKAKPFMTVGAVVCIGEHTFLLQHNSSRPISDKLIVEKFPTILKYARVQQVETD